MDVNHRGRISYADFRRAAADLNLGMNHHEIECLMTIIDVNNDGYISLGELRTALGDKSQNDFMSATRVSRVGDDSQCQMLRQRKEIEMNWQFPLPFVPIPHLT